jgi:hypothetical protein
MNCGGRWACWLDIASSVMKNKRILRKDHSLKNAIIT